MKGFRLWKTHKLFMPAAARTAQWTTITKNVEKGHLVSVYGPHTQDKCLLKALIFGTFKKNIIMYSQLRFQLYQLHSLTVTGLKSGKISKYWVSVGLLETSM